MSIAYPINFALQSIQSERLLIDHKQAVMSSAFTGSQQSVHNFSQWRLTWTWARMSHPEAEVVQGWLDSLQGQLGTFLYRPRQAYGSGASNKSLASPGYLYSTGILVGGFTANQPSNLRVGQFFQLGDQLLRIVAASAIADAAGQVTIEFQPMLRSTYAAGTGVNFTNPRGLFRLAGSQTPAFTLDPDRYPEFGTIEAVEAL
jgi:hypothetical protein